MGDSGVARLEEGVADGVADLVAFSVSHVTLTTKPHSKGDTRLSDRQTGSLRNAETLVNATLALENCVRDNEMSFHISCSVCIS